MNEQNTMDHSTNFAQLHQQVDRNCFGKAKLERNGDVAKYGATAIAIQ